MGQLVVSKAILADVCDDNNMSMAVSVLVTGFEVCVIFGNKFRIEVVLQFHQIYIGLSILRKFQGSLHI